MTGIVIILIASVVLGLVLIVESAPFRSIGTPPDPEKAFTEYLATELRKAQAGAANAEEWAVTLLDEWRKRGPQG